MVYKKFIIFDKPSRNYKFYNSEEDGLVFSTEDYIYSNTKDYSGEKGILNDVIVIK
ncbi:MAG: hypothetical protein IMY72_01565 [Bacteroidetes bacterium]|nr:hypothetical protein [Bacteroidota bacterium]